eukprot:TRINITY_DN7528_c0_g1_i1.p1 TRINITY_DN7528_c0_g1~~TRINITY_DN7528_c0_g1_i1.p1  ORF type:complete len:120 (-),score=14.48 TRINITY_DN7528_c0_g1_i1:63-422(-)
MSVFWCVHTHNLLLINRAWDGFATSVGTLVDSKHSMPEFKPVRFSSRRGIKGTAQLDSVPLTREDENSELEQVIYMLQHCFTVKSYKSSNADKQLSSWTNLYRVQSIKKKRKTDTLFVK